MIQSFLVQENKVPHLTTQTSQPPPTKFANEHTHVLLGPIPADGQTANSVLYLGFCWEEAKLNNVLIKSRAEWWEEPGEGTQGPYSTQLGRGIQTGKDA